MSKSCTDQTKLFVTALFFFPLNLLFNPEPAQNKNPIEATLVVNLPPVTVLPDSPIYQIKRFLEDTRLRLAGSQIQKANLLLNFDQTRLAEAVQLLKQQKFMLVDQTITEHRKILDQIKTINLSLADGKTKGPFQNQLENQEQKLSLFDLLAGEYKMSWQR